MYSKKISAIIIILSALIFSSCEAFFEKDITVSGTIEVEPSKAVTGNSIFLVIARTIDYQKILNDPLNAIVDMVMVDSSGIFSIDLSESNVNAGDKVCFFAFSTENYQGGIPNLTQGDIVGYYIDQATYNYYYTLKSGENSGIVVSLDKEYKTNNASVSGIIKGPDSGDVMVIAYTGEITSMDSNIDYSKVIGFGNVAKPAVDTPYTMELLPFCPSFPIANVYIIAVLDVNRNGIPDTGDRLGFHLNTDKIPAVVTLNDRSNTGIDIEFTMDYTEPSTGDAEISISGTITPPAGYTADISTKPVFIVITSAADADELFENPMAAIKYFVKLEQGTTAYNIDLTNAGLKAGDEIRIIALWDRDYTGGFPGLSSGDMIGYYQNSQDFSYSIVLQDGVNTAPLTDGWTFSLNKIYGANNAVVNGTITGTDSGKVIIIAYNGEINSLDAEIDMDKIIGNTEITKGTSEAPYSMDLFPFINSFPVSDVYIIAVLDRNNNGKPDEGDKLGFYSNKDSGIPSLVTLGNTANNGYNIEFSIDYSAPVTGGTPMTLSGSITAPSGYSTAASSDPIFIIIAKAENTFDLFENPMSAIKYFVKLPQGSTLYNIDLTNTGLVPGDEIRILALWDRDYTGGFPDPTAGDKIGYYQHKSSLSYSKVLAAGANSASLTNGWSFGVNKTLYNHNGQFRFQIKQNGFGALSSGSVIGRDALVVMIYKAGVDDKFSIFEWIPSFGITDMDYIISIDYIHINNLDEWHTVDMFPFIYDNIPKGSSPLRIEDVYIYVILDSNSNGWPDNGEYLGYYWTWLGVPYIYNTQLPMLYPTLYYDRVNTLSGEVISIFNRQYE